MLDVSADHPADNEPQVSGPKEKNQEKLACLDPARAAAKEDYGKDLKDERKQQNPLILRRRRIFSSYNIIFSPTFILYTYPL